MTPLLLALLIWILIGGALWALLVNAVEIGYEVGKELGIPPNQIDYMRTSKTFLIIILIIGPALIIPALIAGIYNWIKELYKGESK